MVSWHLTTSALRFIKNRSPKWIIGADEVGYGAIAGPYAVGAFLAPFSWPSVKGVRDSKKMTPGSRERVYKVLSGEANTLFHVYFVSNKHIDASGPTRTLNNLFHLAVEDLMRVAQVTFDTTMVILDGQVKIPLPHFAVEKADNHVPMVSAASIVAKVERDRWMTMQHEKWPMYRWNQNKGYGTPDHISALKKHGPCELHRLSYEPVTTIWRSCRAM